MSFACGMEHQNDKVLTKERMGISNEKAAQGVGLNTQNLG